MIKATKHKEIGLWEAWIEFDSITPGYFGMLYVFGEIEMKKALTHPFVLKREQGSKDELVLKIDPTYISSGAPMQEVLYSEPLFNIDQYASITVFAGEELIEKIEEIEILV